MMVTACILLAVVGSSALSVGRRTTTSTLLCDGATPKLLVDVDAVAVDDVLGARSSDAVAAAVADALYIHCRVVSAPAFASTVTAVARDADRCHEPIVLARLDVALPPGGAYLAMGLNNHYDAGYYWARSMGPNACKPAPGIRLRVGPGGLAEVTRVDKTDAAVYQTNDGKRSEWCDYLNPGDECDLIPADPLAALAAFDGHVAGVSRQGRPHGSEPLLTGEWTLPPWGGLRHPPTTTKKNHTSDSST